MHSILPLITATTMNYKFKSHSSPFPLLPFYFYPVRATHATEQEFF